MAKTGWARPGVDAVLGRPREKNDARNVCVYLSVDVIEKARRLGHGNMTRGVELAVRAAPNVHWEPIVRDEDTGQG